MPFDSRLIIYIIDILNKEINIYYFKTISVVIIVGLL